MYSSCRRLWPRLGVPFNLSVYDTKERLIGTLKDFSERSTLVALDCDACGKQEIIREATALWNSENRLWAGKNRELGRCVHRGMVQKLSTELRSVIDEQFLFSFKFMQVSLGVFNVAMRKVRQTTEDIFLIMEFNHHDPGDAVRVRKLKAFIERGTKTSARRLAMQPA